MVTDREILEAGGKYKSRREAARSLGIPETTFRQRLRRLTANLDAEGIKNLRNLEAQLSSAKSKLDIEQQKRNQAESELRQVEHALQSVMETRDGVNPRRVDRRGRQPRGQATAILCVNDWHVEGLVDKDVVGGANEFNIQVAESRIQRLWQKAVYLLNFSRSISDVRDLVIWLGGDLINGSIHEELEESNFLGPTEAILFVQDHVAGGLEYLLKETDLEHIHVATSYGNHARTTRKPRITTGYLHSWEWLAYNNLARHYSGNDRVTFQVEKGYHTWVDVQGYSVRFHHGEAIKFSGGIGGVTIPLRKKIAQWNKVRPAYLDVVGHFHQYMDAWDIVLCGCLIGYDAYGVSIGGEFQPPTQTFMVIDRNHGKVMSMPIFV